jgi:hypothetical protein
MSLYQGDRVNLTMTSPVLGGFNLYVFAPNNRITPAFSNSSQGDPVSINFNSTMTGWWTIEINGTGFGFYNWTLDIQGLCDFNNDNTVNILDAITLANHYGTSRGDPGYWAAVDLNNDGTINILDAITFAYHFGQTEWTPPAGSGSGQLQKSKGPLMQGALQTAGVSVSPTQTTVFKGETFNVSVGVSSVTDLNGWQFTLYWDRTMLNCTGAAPQSPTEWGGNTIDMGPGLQSNYNSTHSRYSFARAVTDQGSPFNGSTTIATLTFQALQPGTTSLTLTDTLLGNSTAQPITCGVSSGSVTVYYGRYMRSDTQTINGLNAYKLNIPESNSSASNTQYGDEPVAYWGIRAWVRHSNGTEQELSLDGQTGTPMAVVSRSSGGPGLQSATVTVAQTMLQPTDSLVVRVYTQGTLSATFTTEQLQATTLQATTWTIYYCTYAHWNRYTESEIAKLYWGTTTYNTRIQNLQYT